MKRFIYLIVALLIVGSVSAQSRSFDDMKKQQQSRFSKFKADKQAELEAFRKQQNERYAQFMEESWQRFHAHPAILPKKEKRVKPVIYQEPEPVVEPTPVVEPAPVVEPTPVVEPVDTTPAPAPVVEPTPVVEPEPVVEPVDTTPAPTPVVEPAPVVEPEPVVEPVDTTPAPSPVVEPAPVVEPEPVVEPVDTTPAPAPVVEPVDTTPAPAPVVEPTPAPQPKEEPKVEPKTVVEPKPAPQPKVEEKPILVKKEVIKVPKPAPAPEPLAPVEPKEEIPYTKTAITFYGTKVAVGFPTNETFKLAGLSEKQLAKAWTQLSSEAYDVTLNNALAMREKLALCDWGYIEMLQAVSEKKYGKSNEAVFMQAFLLSQSGYKIRMATDDDKLYMLIATQQNMFSLPFSRKPFAVVVTV